VAYWWRIGGVLVSRATGQGLLARSTEQDLL